jgi:hypothetical protein
MDDRERFFLRPSPTADAHGEGLRKYLSLSSI